MLQLLRSRAKWPPRFLRQVLVAPGRRLRRCSCRRPLALLRDVAALLLFLFLPLPFSSAAAADPAAAPPPCRRRATASAPTRAADLPRMHLREAFQRRVHSSVARAADCRSVDLGSNPGAPSCQKSSRRKRAGDNRITELTFAKRPLT